MKRQCCIGKSSIIADEVVDPKQVKNDSKLSCPKTQCEDGALFRNEVSHEVNTNSATLSSDSVSECVNTQNLSVDVNRTTDEHLCNVPPEFTRISDSFYNVPCEELAKKLLGKILVRTLENGVVLKGRIVETECYLGGEDKASHSYNGKVTPRNKPMYMKPGTTYVYFTYGMYFCFNISSQGDGAAVLVRALDPLQGHEYMILQRVNKRLSSKKNTGMQLVDTPSGLNSITMKHHELCNGPGKLCVSFCIDSKSCNMQDLCTWDGMWIESDCESEKVGLDDVITSTRIGINSAGAEWALKPLRFYVFGNSSVSKRDRKKEQEKVHLLKCLER